MSGLEVVQVLSSALSLLEIVRRSAMFVKDARHADRHLRELHRKIKQLHRVVESVELLIHRRKSQRRGSAVKEEEERIWKNLKSSLDACNKLLVDFTKTVQSPERPNPTALQKARIQFTLDFNETEITRLQSSIDTHVQAIQVYTHILQQFTAESNHEELLDRTERIEVLVRALSYGRQQLVTKSLETTALGHLAQGSSGARCGNHPWDLNPKILSEKDSDVATITEFVDVASQVLQVWDPEGVSLRNIDASAMDIKFDIKEVYDEDESDMESDDVLDEIAEKVPDLVPGRPRGSSLEVPTRVPVAEVEKPSLVAAPKPPSTFQKTPLKLLESFIRRCQESIQTCDKENNPGIALEKLDKLTGHLEEREALWGIKFDNKHELSELKAYLKIRMKCFDSAEHILRDLLHQSAMAKETLDEDDKRSAELNEARCYYLLGEAHLEAYLHNTNHAELVKAKENAQFAFNARHHLLEDHSCPEFVQSVELCIRVYEEFKDLATAEDYRQLLPETPMVTPDIGKDESADHVSQPASYGSSFNIAEIVDIDALDPSGRPPLIRAIRSGDLSLVRECLDRGADVNCKDKIGVPAILYASESGSENIVKMLLERGVRIDETDSKKKQTALHRAAIRNKTLMTRILLENRANIEARDRQGLTPLMRAVQHNNALVVQILLEHNANTNARAVGGSQWAPLHFAVQKDAPEMIRLLLSAKEPSDVHSTCTGGKTALHYACETGARRCVELLLDRGSNINRKDAANGSPLYFAVQSSHDEIVRLLLGRRAQVDKNSLPPQWKKYKTMAEQIQGPEIRRRDSNATAKTSRSFTSTFSAISRPFSKNRN